MSDVISQLAEEARTMVPDGLVVDEWVAAYNKAFANLLITECVSVMKLEEKKPAGFLQSKNVDIHEAAILNHFGIERLTKREKLRKDFEDALKDGVDLSGKDTP